MHSKAIVATLAALSVAGPVLSAPLPAPAGNPYAELEARAAKLPSGAIKDVLKNLGSGVLTGGAISGLLALLGLAGKDAPAARDLEDRGLKELLTKLIGAGDEGLASVLKKAILGGAAGGVAIEAVDTAAGQRRAAVGGAAATAAKSGIGKVIAGGLAGGVGSALGGLGITAIFEKLFGIKAAAARRAVEDLSDDEVKTLLAYVNEVENSSQLEARGGVPSGLGRTLANIIKSMLGGKGKRAVEDLSDDEVKTLLAYVNEVENSSQLEARGGVPSGLGRTLANIIKSMLGGKGKRAVEDLSDDEVNTLLKYVNEMENSSQLEARGGVPSGLGQTLINIIKTMLGKGAKRSVEDLSDDEVNALAAYIKEVENSSGLEARGGVPSGLSTTLLNIIKSMLGKGKRSVEDLSNEEVNTLLEYIDASQNEKRAVALGSVGKGIAGLIASLAATQGAEAAIEQLKKIFSARSVGSYNDLD
ncbi:hypothetical protein B0H15DRAFT_584694 [Mycena belliarum]|uniref:Uncharacterized protein n=1 Tax=Mycena belliarum TaxID=1033014 RepID=A0AAD6XWZ4_9AGAR|nr:hypothetical protein B0H15DRAFT_584694 [Mycena belliae]